MAADGSSHHIEVNMPQRDVFVPSARRSFLSRFGAALAAAGATFGAGAVSMTAQGASDQRWQPTRHAEDDWYDKLPGKHRTILDAVSGQGVGDALHFASNILTTSKSGYGLDSGDLAVVICLRHGATAFAFADPMWAKYSEPMSSHAKFTDPKTKAPAVVNAYNSAEYRGLLANGPTTIDSLIKQGVHFAVCAQSTHGYAGDFARRTNGTADAIYKELTSNLIGNSHMVPSGIVAVGHAQEHGYAYVYTG
jgi:intracellular sulfur oxidation DsrE/DsrF family protein